MNSPLHFWWRQHVIGGGCAGTNCVSPASSSRWNYYRSRRGAILSLASAWNAESGFRLGGFMLEINSLSVGYCDKMILNNVSLTVHPGEVVALIGPNGAGKSTLIRAISGVLPTRAEMSISVARNLDHISRQTSTDIGSCSSSAILACVIQCLSNHPARANTLSRLAGTSWEQRP